MPLPPHFLQKAHFVRDIVEKYNLENKNRHVLLFLPFTFYSQFTIVKGYFVIYFIVITKDKLLKCVF